MQINLLVNILPRQPHTSTHTLNYSHMQNDPLKQLSKQRKPLIGDDHYFYGNCEKKKIGFVNMISGPIFHNKISFSDQGILY